MHHSLIKLETAQKMFANFLVSKGTKLKICNKMKLHQDQLPGSYYINEVKEIMIFQL